MTYIPLFLDTETTGTGPQDRLVQVAFKYKDAMVSELFKAPVPMSIEAMEVTHITPRMIENKDFFEGSAIQTLLREILQDPKTIFIAHNALFDLEMIQKEGLTVGSFIDTLRIARILDKDSVLPAYRLQYLRYAMKLDNHINEELTAHDAKSDVLVLEQLYNRLYEKIENEMNNGVYDESSPEETMIRLSQEPVLIKTFTFGKHKGRTIEEIAKEAPDYLKWLYEQKIQKPEGEDDWIHTLKHYLQIR